MLDRLVANLQNDKILDSLFRIAPDSGLPNIEKQYPNEFKILNECGITDASSHNNPNRTRWYYFRTNWVSNYPILLSWYPKKYHDSSQTVKGYYRKDHYANEWWGLGDGWQMLRLIKTIDYIKQ